MMATQKVKLNCGYEIEFFDNSEFILKEIWEDGYYDKNFQIHRNSVVADFGANQGFFSLYAASKGALVFSVEPDQDNFQLLSRNIAANALEKQIFPYNYAISRTEGDIEIFVPQADKLCTTGLITTNKELSQSFAKLNVSNVVQTTIQGITLKSFLQKIGQQKIDLLKIDCEGAELEIMQSGDIHDFEKIENIVMETHAAYSEKELFHCVKQHGFHIVSYQKLEGTFATGYLFCTRDPAAYAMTVQAPIAILKSPDHGICADRMVLDGSDSFSVQDKNRSLQYTWDINNIRMTDSHESCITFTPATPGHHKVTLTVDDNGLSDVVSQHVWAFSAEYGAHPGASPVGELSEVFGCTVSARQVFMIPQDRLPKTWNYKAIALAVSIQSKEEPAAVAFVFDGQRMLLNKDYQVLRFPYYPNACDLFFTLETDTPLHVELRWYAEEEEEEKATEHLFVPAAERVEMGEKSKAHVCELKQSTEFIIRHDQLPSHWTPKCIKVCFSAHASDPRGNQLNGEIRFAGKSHTLNSGYQEYVLREKPEENDIAFSVSVPQERVYQLTWWPE